MGDGSTPARDVATGFHAGQDKSSFKFALSKLSPLDAFQARGRMLSNQIMQETSQGRTSEEYPRSHRNSDMTDAFAFDDKLQTGRNKYIRPAENRPVSIRSEVASVSEASSIRSQNNFRDSHSSYVSDASTIRLVPADGDETQQWDISPDQANQSRRKVSPSGSSMQSNTTYSASSTNRSRAPSEYLESPNLASTRSSPTSSIYSISSLKISSTDQQALPGALLPSPAISGRSEYNFSRPRHSFQSTSMRTSDLDTPTTPASFHVPPGEDQRFRTSRVLYSPVSSPRSVQVTPDRAEIAGGIVSYSSSSRKDSITEVPRRPSLRTAATTKSAIGNRSTSNFSNSRVASLPDAALDAATHIELGIEQHESNALPQSTHHFKVAADMGDPTGCLLYGLALRHGWGVRPDLTRSLVFLQRAADSAILNVDNLRNSKLFPNSSSSLSLSTAGGDLGIAIYELGVSYKNGWGVTADKKLCLKYFELASEWGDVEAMIEAAECHLHGTGCKKDKFKAASYLRRAEAKGKKEIGNSWIWKSKYDVAS